MCASVPQHPTAAIPPIEQLSLDEKVGQMFAVIGHGVFMSESSMAYEQLLHHVRANHVGAVMWSISNVYETAQLTARLQRESHVPLLISADLESGMGMRFLDTTYWPWAMAVAATGDPSLAEQEGRVVAREARMVGINHIYAPIADVNVDADNPVINTRSFGEDPADVSRYVAAFVRGVQSEHVLATAKHFPGHGDTHVDSHRSLPILDVDRKRLDHVELLPFRAAIDAGVRSIMIGHLAVPSLDDELVPVRPPGPGENPYGTTVSEVPQNGTMPATISKKMVTGLLRHDLKFDGLVVSDAMDMGGITEHFSAGEAAVRAIEAGQDQILMSPNVDEAVSAVKAAVASGQLSTARIDESVRRILAAKAFAGVPGGTADEIFRGIDSKEHRELAQSIARRAITLVREQTGSLPVKKGARVVIITVSEFQEVVSPLPDFEREMRRRLTVPPQTFLIDARSSAESIGPIALAAQNADAVIFAMAVRTRSGSGTIAVPESARTLLAGLAPRVPTYAISFGTPYLLREIASTGTYICAYGIQPVMQVAAVHALFGEAPVSGKLPVTIPGLAPRGTGIAKQ
ncbi:MAG: beta-N-acetylhexosaminidase [Thermoanaerobaculia bacterium]|jgi:beta-glucosidase-like glycosyl hydrolase|nr:beta-N-acetylhexosaminidase [Thermoanaerobaculia bacterium]